MRIAASSPGILNSDAAKRGFAQIKRFANGIRYLKGQKTGFLEKSELAAALGALGLAEVGRRDVTAILDDIDLVDEETGKKDGKKS